MSSDASHTTVHLHRGTTVTLDPNATHLVDLCQRFRWNPEILGQAPMPRAPITMQNWWVVPSEQDRTPLPLHARQRMEIIRQSGLPVQGFIVVHEPRPALAGADSPREPSNQLWAALKRLPWDRIISTVASLLVVGILVALAIGLILAMIAAVVAVLLAALVPLVIVAVLGAVIADPCLIVVAGDGTWVLIDRWWT